MDQLVLLEILISARNSWLLTPSILTPIELSRLGIPPAVFVLSRRIQPVTAFTTSLGKIES